MALPSEKLAQSLAVLRQVQQTKKSIRMILGGSKASAIVEKDYRRWYQEMFAPSVMAGIIKISDIAGYRSNQVYIRNSKYTPLSPGPSGMRCLYFLICLKMSQTLGPCRSGTLHFHVHTPIYGRKRTNGAFPYECYARLRWLPLDNHLQRHHRRLYGSH